eukprot:2435429-Pyramimonas_sp.AAC.1
MRAINGLATRITIYIMLVRTHSEIHQELRWLHEKQHDPSHMRGWAIGWDRFRKKGRITWEAPPRKIRRLRKLKKVAEKKRLYEACIQTRALSRRSRLSERCAVHQAVLKMTEGTGVNVYTHGELLPAHGYPELRKYTHLAGHYGGAWYRQKMDFYGWPGSILITTNCVMEPPDESYEDNLFTTGNESVVFCKRL